MSGREDMIKKCESFLGTVGRPNEATRWYAARNGSYYADAAWCDMFITWAAYHSGNYEAVCHGKDYAYTVYHAQRFQQAGEWHTDTAGIQRGDIVFFDWDGTNSVGAIDHIGIVTDVNGRDVLTIEGNTSDRCARRVRDASTIVGYGRPKYEVATPPPGTTPRQTWEYTVVAGDTLSKLAQRFGVDVDDIAELNGIRNVNVIAIGQKLLIPGRPPAGTPTPPPPPPPPPVYAPPAFPAGLKPDSSSPSAKPLQKALKAAGYMAQSVTLADNYGPVTQTSVKKFHAANPSFGSATDGAIGPLGWAELHREAYGGTGTTPTPTPPPADDDEPAHDYRRVTFGGKTVNVRTKVMLEAAGVTSLSQGSYNAGGVAASAGTHDGGGVVDIPSSSTTLLKKLREVGFAAWIRTPAEGFSYHIHACAIGDREMSSVARNQVKSYFNGRNGLANNGPDSAPASVGRPYPAWAAKYR
jgi:LysM repeat protein